jgi:Family of unknown function (DUF5681)
MTGSHDEDDRVRKPRSSGVGFGKPPVASRFKPGQSGNPKGRPKGSRNSAKTEERRLLQLILTDAERRVMVNDGGKARKLSKSDVIVRTLSNKAMKGDPRAMRDWINLQKVAEEETRREREVAAASQSNAKNSSQVSETFYDLGTCLAFALRKGLEHKKDSDTDTFEDLMKPSESK